MAKIAHEKWDTFGNVFDNYTLRNLFRLESRGLFEHLDTTVALGKEANIFSAKSDPDVIVKIYRLETCDFNRMYDYIKYDPRYIGLRKQKRKVIFAWCQREYRNLLKLRDAGVRVPKPIAFLDNILILELIRSDETQDGIAPKIKDTEILNPEEFFKKILLNLNLFYVKAGLVHGDISEFNILNENGNPVIIDVSQSLPVDAPRAEELLERDSKNLVRFFTRLGLDLDISSVINKIKGIEKI